MTGISTLKRAVATILPSAPALDTSAAIRAAIVGGEQRTAELVKATEQLYARRAVLLVDGSDDDLDAVDAEIASAGRQQERIEARVDELHKRLAEAEAWERTERLDAVYERGRQHQEAGRDALLRYSKLAAQMRDVLIEVVANDRRRRELNAELLQAGDTRHVDAAERLLVGDDARWAEDTALRVALPIAASPNLVQWPLSGSQLTAALLSTMERISR